MVLCFLFKNTFHFAYTIFLYSVLWCIVLCFMAYCILCNIRLYVAFATIFCYLIFNITSYDILYPINHLSNMPY